MSVGVQIYDGGAESCDLISKVTLEMIKSNHKIICIRANLHKYDMDRTQWESQLITLFSGQ